MSADDETPPPRIAYLGKATLRKEGALHNFDTGEQTTDPAAIAAWRESVKASNDAARKLANKLWEPGRIDQAWARECVDLAKISNDSGDMDDIRHAFLRKLALGMVDDAAACADLLVRVDDEGDTTCPSVE